MDNFSKYDIFLATPIMLSGIALPIWEGISPDIYDFKAVIICLLSDFLVSITLALLKFFKLAKNKASLKRDWGRLQRKARAYEAANYAMTICLDMECKNFGFAQRCY